MKLILQLTEQRLFSLFSWKIDFGILSNSFGFLKLHKKDICYLTIFAIIFIIIIFAIHCLVCMLYMYSILCILKQYFQVCVYKSCDLLAVSTSLPLRARSSSTGPLSWPLRWVNISALKTETYWQISALTISPSVFSTARSLWKMFKIVSFLVCHFIHFENKSI